MTGAGDLFGVKAGLRTGLVCAGLLLAVCAQAQSITPGANPNAPAPGGFAPPPQAASATRTAQTTSTTTSASGQKHVKTEVMRKGRSGNDIFLGTYLTLSADCKVGTNPTVEFTEQPKNGKTKLRSYPINLRDVPGAPKRSCIGTSPRGVAAVYHANPRFKGEDQLSFKVIYPNGDIREVSAKITVQ